MRSIDELKSVLGWLKQVETVVGMIEKARAWKKDWKYVARIKELLKSLKTLQGILDGVKCTGALKESLMDLVEEIVGDVRDENWIWLLTQEGEK